MDSGASADGDDNTQAVDEVKGIFLDEVLKSKAPYQVTPSTRKLEG